MTENIAVNRDTLKKLLKMHRDVDDFLNELPKLLDEGRVNEASSHIGAELEARITEMDEIKEESPEIADLIAELSYSQTDGATTLDQLEEEVLQNNG